jgi:drug/metabolite transporter (DMT)-like permease
MDGIAKHLSADLPVLQVVWARYFFHLLVLLPIVLPKHGLDVIRVPNQKLQILRGGLLLGSTMLFFTAISEMPLADALALIFLSPLIVTALSPFVLGEQVGVRRWSAVLVGFCGALVIVRPGMGVFSGAAVYAVAAGCVYACYLLATRKLARSAPPMVTLTYTALLGAVVMTVIVLPIWVTPSLEQLALMLAMGAIAAAGHFMLIRAFDFASASVLAPFTYFEILMMTLVGYVWFGDFPDLYTWIGAGILAASGIYISWRERVRGVSS